jgi:hypothetical protein
MMSGVLFLSIMSSLSNVDVLGVGVGGGGVIFVFTSVKSQCCIHL